MTGGDWLWILLGFAIVAGALYLCWAAFWFVFDLFVSEGTKIAHRERSKLGARDQPSARDRL